MASSVINVASTGWQDTGLTGPCLIQLISNASVEVILDSSTPSVAHGMHIESFGETLLLSGSGTVYAKLNRASPSATLIVTPSVSGSVSVFPAIPIPGEYLPVRLTDGTSFYNASGGGGSNPNGQATMANSAPVVIASDQTSLEVSLDTFSLSALENIQITNTTLPLPTGAATEATLAALNGKTPSLGQTVAASSVPVTLATDKSVSVVSAYADYSYSSSAVVSSNTDLLIMDCTGYAFACVEVTSNPNFATLQPATSVAGVTYDTSTWTTKGGSYSTSVGSTGTFFVPLAGAKFFRIRTLSPLTSGTTTINVRLTTQTTTTPMSIQSVSIANGTIGSATLAAGTNLAADVGTQYRASATGAASIAKLISANSTNATVVKASAGRLVGWQLQNTTASIVYVKLHNIATTPTAGSTAVVAPIAIPANGKSEVTLDGGMGFNTGISFTTVTGAADADATAVAANAIIGSFAFA